MVVRCSIKLDLRGVAFRGIFDLKEFGGLEAKHAGEDDVGKHFASRVVGHDAVVVGLTGEGDFVFSRSEFLGELHHILVGLEIGVLLGDDHEAGERATQAGLGREQAFHGVAIGGVGGGRLSGGGGDVARLDDGFERGALVLHVALGGFDEVGNEIVAALELHVDLSVGVFETVAQGDEGIVDAGDPEADDDHDGEQNSEGNEGWDHDNEVFEIALQCVEARRRGEAELITTRLIVSTAPSNVRGRMSFRTLFIPLFIAIVPVVRAAEPPMVFAPLVTSADAPPASSEGLRMFVAARRALELGFPSVAADLYRQLLDAPQPTGAERNTLVLDMTSALLDDGRTGAAEQALKGYFGLPTAAYHLRAGLVAMRGKQTDAARAELAAMKADELTASDRGWFYFLQGQLADEAGDFTKARDAYQQAFDSAVSGMQRARFMLAREQVRLRLGEATDEQAVALRQNFERYQGKTIGYGYARQYAVMLAALGHTTEAVGFLNVQLQSLPLGERAAADDFRLLLGLIAGVQGQGVGRKALEELLVSASDPDLQRVALQLMARGLSDALLRGAFLEKLDGLINAASANPILEDILLTRAQMALVDKNYAQAETAAKALREKFPGSPLKAAALGVLAGSAWEQRRYRTAADYAAQAKDAQPTGDLHASLGVLVAEAYFRAQDFRSADDAYAAALNEIPSGVAAGVLMSQRVRSEIEDARLDDAGKLLDAFERDPRFDAINRWQTEWALARAMQVVNRTDQALQRVTTLMADASNGASALPSDLRVRLKWLQAQLSFDAGKFKEALELAKALLGSLDGLEAALRIEVEASTRLLQAKANFQLGQPEVALELLQSLRMHAELGKTDAAVYSYIDEADYYAKKNDFVKAQDLLTTLADTFKDHAYAPYALYRAALNAERRGEAKYYQQADAILARIIKYYPQSDLVFFATLKHGDLQRRLNLFDDAEQTYLYIRNNYAQHPSELLAEMALAACYRAKITLSDKSQSHFESAATIYERIQELPAASVEMRVEASFQLGDLLATRANADYKDNERAQAVWWMLVTTFLLDDTKAAQLGVKGRYWIARTLLRYGDLLAQQGKLEQARNAYELILRKNLPFAKLAKDSFVRSGGKP